MLNYITNYFKKNKYMVTTYENGLYIYNYLKIIDINNTRIEVLVNSKKIIVDGENMAVIKLLDNELLLKGKIINIKVIDYE